MRNAIKLVALQVGDRFIGIGGQVVWTVIMVQNFGGHIRYTGRDEKGNEHAFYWDQIEVVK